MEKYLQTAEYDDSRYGEDEEENPVVLSDYEEKGGQSAYSIIIDYYNSKSEKPKKKKGKKKRKKGNERPQENYDKQLSHYRNILDALPFMEDIGQVPEYMNLSIYRDSGVCLGIPQYREMRGQYVGKPQDDDGHVLVVGGPGSGKSSSIAIPTLRSWKSPIVALDVKGELVEYYQRMRSATRPTKVFSPHKSTGPTYDPLYFIRRDELDNLVSNVSELVNAIIPLSPNERDSFWKTAARKIVKAAIIYYLDSSKTFIQILEIIVSHPIDQLIQQIGEGENLIAKYLISSYLEKEDLSDSEMLMDIAEQLSLHLMEFVTDSRIQRALSPSDDTIQWDRDLGTYNIFLSIPEYRLDTWGSMVNLMFTQLIRWLERRPEKYSIEGQSQEPILLHFDEFPRIGKMEVIANALSTLRSKNVTICLFIQSLAQLDYVYSPEVRRIILDTCSYKVVLGVNDYDSQLYFSNLTGTTKVWQRSYSETFNPDNGSLGYSRNLNESREQILQSHEFAILQDDLILLHPEGYSRINKLPYFRKSFDPTTN